MTKSPVGLGTFLSLAITIEGMLVDLSVERNVDRWAHSIDFAE